MSIMDGYLEECNCRETALFLHEMGLPVVLCREENPIRSDWRTCRYTASEIESEFDSEPDLNVGLPLGPDSNLVEVVESLDDRGRPATLAIYDLLEEAFPLTPTFESRRAYHRLFAWDDRFRPIEWPEVRLGSLIIRSGAGESDTFALIPPSITDGVSRGWRLTPDDCRGNIALLPDRAVDQIVSYRPNPSDDVVAVGGRWNRLPVRPLVPAVPC